MLSKITIHTAPNNRPCIRVIENKSEEDVRDVLVQRLREELSHTSTTFSYCPTSDNEYLLSPVNDELSYFEGVIMNRYVEDSGSREQLLKMVSLISTALDTNVKTDAANTVHINKSQLEEYRSTGVLNYSSK